MGRAIIPGFRVVVKPTRVMGEYIALHGLVPRNELPKKLRGKIPKNEVWIRGDVYRDPVKRRKILHIHEKKELYLMGPRKKKSMKYKPAHKEAELRELTWFVPLVEQDITPIRVQKEIKKQSKKFLNKKIKINRRRKMTKKIQKRKKIGKQKYRHSGGTLYLSKQTSEELSGKSNIDRGMYQRMRKKKSTKKRR